MVAQELNDLKAGTYVGLHGLNNALYNDLEGRVVGEKQKEMKKGARSVGRTINVLCKDTAGVMPTSKISRYK